jgi:hypothetical protein
VSTPARCAVTAGLIVASVTSAGILVDRIMLGAFRAALLGDVLTTIVALAVSIVAARAFFDAGGLGWSLVGAAIGIATVHAVAVVLHPVPWLTESPRQLVNDITASVATLGLVYVCAARRVELHRVVLVTSVIAFYAVTHAFWHVDRAPIGFTATVQQCVVAQYVSVMLALLVFRALRRPLDEA